MTEDEKLVLEALNEMLDADDAGGGCAGGGPRETPSKGLEEKMKALGFVCCGFCSAIANREHGIRFVWHRASAEACAEIGFGGEERVN